MARFNIIAESEYNDFERSIELTEVKQLRSRILGYLGSISPKQCMLITALDLQTHSSNIRSQDKPYLHVTMILLSIKKYVYSNTYRSCYYIIGHDFRPTS